jgi:hypothetical protein
VSDPKERLSSIKGLQHFGPPRLAPGARRVAGFLSGTPFVDSFECRRNQAVQGVQPPSALD